MFSLQEKIQPVLTEQAGHAVEEKLLERWDGEMNHQRRKYRRMTLVPRQQQQKKKTNELVEDGSQESLGDRIHILLLKDRDTRKLREKQCCVMMKTKE